MPTTQQTTDDLYTLCEYHGYLRVTLCLARAWAMGMADLCVRLAGGSPWRVTLPLVGGGYAYLRRRGGEHVYSVHDEDGNETHCHLYCLGRKRDVALPAAEVERRLGRRLRRFGRRLPSP